MMMSMVGFLVSFLFTGVASAQAGTTCGTDGLATTKCG